jgi:uncharacterized protein involved in cysteine biosynthesis
MIAALVRAFLQLYDPVFRRVVGRAFLWSMALFAAMVGLSWWLIASIRYFELDWLDTLVDALGWAASLIVAIFLFPSVALMAVSLLLEDIARAVESRHYPGLPPPRPQGIGEQVNAALRLAAMSLLLNLLALPLYLIPAVNVFVFYGLNGYLLGREYFELVAARRLDIADVHRLWRRYRGRLCLAGAVIAVLLSIPFVGWALPTVATAFMLHLFESLRRHEAAV